MDFLNGVITVVRELGFPVAMCCALFWKINDQDKRHEAETKTLSDVITQNTLAIQHLVDKIGGDK